MTNITRTERTRKSFEYLVIMLKYLNTIKSIKNPSLIWLQHFNMGLGNVLMVGQHAWRRRNRVHLIDWVEASLTPRQIVESLLHVHVGEHAEAFLDCAERVEFLTLLEIGPGASRRVVFWPSLARRKLGCHGRIDGRRQNYIWQIISGRDRKRFGLVARMVPMFRTQAQYYKLLAVTAA